MTVSFANNNMKSSLLDIARIDPKEANKYKIEDTEARVKQQKADFLSLLTTQMKNQDPTNPMDTNTMAQQIFSINQVEQQLETNKHLKEIKDYFASSKIATTAGYIDKLAYFEGNSVIIDDIDVPNEFVYELPEGVAKAEIIISNEKGTMVHREPISIEAGKHVYKWLPGDQYPKGVYKFEIAAKDSDSDVVSAKQWGFGRIKSIFTEGANSALEVNGVTIPLSKVIKISS